MIEKFIQWCKQPSKKQLLIQTQQQLESLTAKQELLDKQKNGTDPWVEIKSADYSVTRGIQIELDWNQPFITYLKDNGFTGREDEDIIRKWLGYLYSDLIGRLEDVAIEKSDIIRPSEFE